MRAEIVMPAYTNAWWYRLANWLGAEMVYSHALLWFEVGDDKFFIEASATSGRVQYQRAWKPRCGVRWLGWWRLKEGNEEIYEKVLAFAENEIGKRYRWEWLIPITWKVVRRIIENRFGS